MLKAKTQNEVTLVDILVDGFEKNEIMDGMHWRQLPMPDDASAIRKFDALVAEATRWKGKPIEVTSSRSDLNGSERQLAVWEGLDIRRTGLAILVRARAPIFDAFWHDANWDSPAFDDLYHWLHPERSEPG